MIELTRSVQKSHKHIQNILKYHTSGYLQHNIEYVHTDQPLPLLLLHNKTRQWQRDWFITGSKLNMTDGMYCTY